MTYSSSEEIRLEFLPISQDTIKFPEILTCTALRKKPLHCMKIYEIGGVASDFETVITKCDMNLSANIF